MSETGENMHIKAQWVRVARQTEEKRMEVRRRSPKIYEKLPKVIVDWVAVKFHRGGWPIRQDNSREARLVMDTILYHYVLIPMEKRGRARVLAWPRTARRGGAEYLSEKPTERYELEHRAN